MTRNDLRAALGSLVERHGFRKVSRLLLEMEPGDGESPMAKKRMAVEPGRTRRTGRERPQRRLSAMDYVQGLKPGAERARIMARAAEAFDMRAFLPTLGDIRAFCEAYGIKEPRANSRNGGIPRIFRFLATMDPAELQKILDDESFAGPSRLGPIADAIRSRAKELRELTPRR